MKTRFLLVTLTLLLFLSAPATALEVTGGTAEQRAYAREVIGAAPWSLPRVEQAYGGQTSIELVGADVTTSGRAFPDGRILIYDGLEPGYDGLLGEAVAHEWAHLYWFGRSADFFHAWVDQCTDGYGEWSYIGAWLRNPQENFAENAKLLWPGQYLALDWARTLLRVWTPEETQVFIDRYDPVPKYYSSSWSLVDIMLSVWAES